MPYVSQGTISVEFDLNEGVDVSASLFFVPTRDYSIKHREEDYAIFVWPEENHIDSIFKKIEARGVEINLGIPAVHVPSEETREDNPDRMFVAEVTKSAVERSSWIAIMSGVSERHSKVEIQVNANLRLTAIRVLVA